MKAKLRLYCYKSAQYADERGRVAYEVHLCAVPSDVFNEAAFAPNPPNASLTLLRTPIKVDGGQIVELELTVLEERLAVLEERPA